ncbi:MAG: AarF/ABC1/UbiB kinase family protein [Verrucomicrobia bacterium]|nr:AarF/ABC1/UbiB kinase family protein [Verrucomicrobiota bacterium]
MKAFDALHHAVRAKEILAVLVRHGFADLLSQIDLPAGFWQRLLPHGPPPRTTAERFHLAAEELGPTFVKLGQLLSMRPDVVPHDIVLELRKLQDRVKPLPFETMRPVLERALGRPPAAVFADFDEVAVASASLAQVYFARRLETGEPVAIKIQKPDLQRRMEIDFDLARWLAGLLQERITALQKVDLVAVLDEACGAILRELDFRHEARNQEYFNTLNPHPERVFAPKVVPELSSECVLVMERISGTPIGQALALPAELRRRHAGWGAESLVRQVFVAGFFHADPHAGNIFVTTDGRLCFLDWGLAGHLTRRLRYALADFWIAAVEQDTEHIVQIAADLAPVNARPDLRAMEKEVTLALREELNFAIGRQALGRAMLRLLFILGQHGIPLSRDYSLMAKAVLSIDEVGRMLDPDFDLRRHTAPVLRELQWERMNPHTVVRRTREMLRHTLIGLQELPFELRRLVRRLEHDDLAINLQHRGLEKHDEAVRVAANRIALGVIIGALIIGSSLIVTTGIQPHLLGYPALGIIGYLLSALLGLYVIWDIIHHGRHR